VTQYVQVDELISFKVEGIQVLSLSVPGVTSSKGLNSPAAQ